MQQQKTVFVIAGPTAVGKTAIAIALAKRLNTSIVSADSRQCYIGMPIGTAQPSAGELAAVRHYFINEFPVTEHITAARYEQLALGYLEEIFTDNDCAVVCGGTGLYIKALCEGLDDMPDVSDEIVQAVTAEYNAKGIEWLKQAVQEADPAFYASGEIQNPSRLQRALSFVRATGESILKYRTQSKKERPFNIIKVALELPREQLYDRVNQRVDAMIAEGLEAEVRALFPLRHLKNLQTVGYSEILGCLNGEYSLDTAIGKIKQHTRNYAKRQLTWFRRDPEFVWLRADDGEVVNKILALRSNSPAL